MIDTYFGNHNHTCYSNALLSFPDAITKVEELIQYAYDLGLSGIAITEHEGISSHMKALKYYEKMKLDRPFKLALGNEIYLMSEAEDMSNREGTDYTPYYHFILTALDTEGHKQLREISSKAWQRAYTSRRLMRRPTYYTDIEEVINSNTGHLIASSACFLAGHKVLTKEGLKNIEDIKTGTLVLTENNSWEKVIEPTCRHYYGKGNIINFSKSTDPTICTENHEFLLFDKKKRNLYWENAKNIKKGDNCLSLINIEYTNKKKMNFSNELKELRKNADIHVANKLNKINSYITITPLLMRVFGLWLADGHITKNKINNTIGFTCNLDDFELYYPWIKKGMSVFNIIPTIYKRKLENRVDINYNSKELVEIWYNIFGLSHAKDKFIPNKLMHISKEFDTELLYGYLLGDGYFRSRNINKIYKTGEIVSATISKKLHENILHLYQSLGFSPNIMVAKEKTDKNNVHHCQSYYLSLNCKDMCESLNKKNILSTSELIQLLDKYAYDKLQFIELNNKKYLRQRVKANKICTIKEKVYCLKVENYHSFICNNVIVHNCLGSYLDKLILTWKKQEPGYKAVQARIDGFMTWCGEVFGSDNFYLEIQPCKADNTDQLIVNETMKELSQQYGIKIIATTDSHYLNEEAAKYHETLLKSKDGDREVSSFYATTYVMSPQELRKYLKITFTDKEIDEIFENSNELSKRIKAYDLKHMPIIPEIPQDKMPEFKIEHRYKKYYDKYEYFKYYAYADNEQDQYFFYRIEQGLKKFIEFHPTKKLEDYINRINLEAKELSELSKIFNSHMAAYYTSVSKIVEICWNSNSFVMPSRGSAFGYLICYLLEIVQLDPVPLGDYAPYWRHLSSARGIEIPDIDVDTQNSKKEIIGHNIKKYWGFDKVLKVATFSEMTSKTSVEKACKGLGISDDIAGYLKSLIPVDRGMIWSLKDCLEGNEKKKRKPVKEFITEIEKYPYLKNSALAFEGIIAGRGQHAAGLIICNEPYVNFIASMRAPNGDLCTCYDLQDCEDCGIVKVDMLTVKASDKLRTTMDLLIEYGYIEWQGDLKTTYDKYLHPDVIEYDNPNMWKIIKNIYSLFQFDTPVSSNAINVIQPKNIMELSATNSILRLMGSGEGSETPLEKYARYADVHEWEKDCHAYGLTEDEMDVIRKYCSDSRMLPESQEKVMLISMDKKVAGFSLKQANKLRKAIAKKDDEVLEATRIMFFEHCIKQGCRELFANYIWYELFGMSFGYVIMVMICEPYQGCVA